MLHTKFRGNQPTGSGEEDFEGFLLYMGVAATEKFLSRKALAQKKFFKPTLPMFRGDAHAYV